MSEPITKIPEIITQIKKNMTEIRVLSTKTEIIVEKIMNKCSLISVSGSELPLTSEGRTSM